jgi:hypothetical protein
MARDYIPRLLEIHAELMPPIDELAAALPGARIEAVQVPCERYGHLRELEELDVGLRLVVSELRRPG